MRTPSVDVYADPPVGAGPPVVAEPEITVSPVPDADPAAEVVDMPDVTKEDVLAVVVALLATIASFGVDLTGEQLASLTALATAVVLVLPIAGAKRRAARVTLVNDREARAASGNPIKP